MEAGDFVKGAENPDNFVRFHIFLVLFCTFWHIKEVFSGPKTLLMPGFCWLSVRIYVLSVCQMHSFSIRGLISRTSRLGGFRAGLPQFALRPLQAGSKSGTS
jgi:hypothetical protein